MKPILTAFLLLSTLFAVPFQSRAQFGCEYPGIAYPCCCETASCSTCEDIAACQELEILLGESPETFATAAAPGDCDVAGTPCSTWWENNTAGVSGPVCDNSMPCDCLPSPLSVVIECPADFTGEVDFDCNMDHTPIATGEPSIQIEGGCGNEEINLTYTDGPYDYPCEGSYSFFRTWTVSVTDGCGSNQTQQCEQQINALDLTEPIIDVGGSDNTVECGQSHLYLSFSDWLATAGGAIAYDNCTNISWMNDYSEGSLSDECGLTASTMVTFVAIDDCGNASSTISLSHTVEDTTSPEYNGPDTLLLDCGVPGTSQFISELIASYAEDPLPCMSREFNAGDIVSLFVGGTEVGPDDIILTCGNSVEVEFNLTDECGNESTFFVTVIHGESGCTSPSACNYNPEAVIEDGSCEYLSCATFGCTNPEACNFSENAFYEDGSCDYSCQGCTDGAAVNHDAEATVDDGSCEYAGCTDAAAVNYDADAVVDDGSCQYAGCTDPSACNHDAGATVEDGSCDFACYGCTDPSACNHDPSATQPDSSCTYGCYGCTNATACNYDATSTVDDGSCTYADAEYDCNGNCLVDADGDGICDAFEVAGCTDLAAPNYDAGATDDDGSCEAPSGAPEEFGFTPTPSSGVILGQVTLNGVPAEVGDWVAAFDESGNCAGSAPVVLEGGTAYVLLTIYGDDATTGSADEGLEEGESFNLQLFQSSTGELIDYYTPTGNTDLDGWSNTNGTPIDGYDNPNAILAFYTEPYSPSCLDSEACNYDPASPGDLNCLYPPAGLDCSYDCLEDADLDGVCDEDEVAGCTDAQACNYDAAATDDDGSCESLDACGICGGPGIALGDCDCAGNTVDALGECGGTCPADADADGICDDVDPCVGTYDACGVCNGPGAVYDCGCAPYPDGACDCEGNVLDAIGECGGGCAADADADGLCDDVDPCVGEIDACGVCNGPGAVYDCGCEDLEPDACDCAGNLLDAIGECGGTCTADADDDGLCDDVDDCIGQLDECGVCNGPGATFECGCGDIPDGDCDCNGNQLDALGECGGTCVADDDNDGICDDVDDCVGQYDVCGVCNGSGDVFDCGCADIPDGECDCNGNQLDALGICGGDCPSDFDGDGVCDNEEVFGCTDSLACNYDPEATEEDQSCAYQEPGLDCSGQCLIDTDGDGICDGDEVAGCPDPEALNYNALATDDDGSCTLPAEPPSQFDFTGTPSSATFLGQATLDGTPCDQGDWVAAFDEGGNCAGASQLIMYQGAAYINLTIYGDDATTASTDEGINPGEQFSLVLWDASALATVAYVDLLGNALLSGWSNTNGAPLPDYGDASEVFDFLSAGYDPNCLDETACNYDADSETNDGCVYPEPGYSCEGICEADADGDGICDANEVLGCTDSDACNYNATATDEDGSCTLPADGYDCEGNCLIDTDGDGTCDPFEILGCTDPTACNYDDSVTEENGSCSYPDPGRDCAGNCVEDADGDGICDGDEISGCQDPSACNYLPDATDSGACDYPASPYEDCAGACFNDVDGDGLCDELDDCIGSLDGNGDCDPLDIPGCTYLAACNFNALANLDDGSCQFVPSGYDCDGNCLEDADSDGVCDPHELAGCTDTLAINYTPLATDDDGSCEYGSVTDCPSDINQDGLTSIADLLLLLTEFGQTCNN